MSKNAPAADVRRRRLPFADLLTSQFSPDPLPKALALAVSGGGDSMAMAHMAAGVAKDLGCRLLALTVDHGLRPESAAEASVVHGWCTELGIEHQILRWNGPKPDTAIQEAARDARYSLMTAACHAAGIGVLATAHTRDDQIETVMMRARRGGGGGISGMSADTSVSGVRLVRPLLGIGRDYLRGELDARRGAWIEDPSNQDPRFERIRVRQNKPQLPSHGIAPDRLLDLSNASAKLRAWNARTASELLARHATWTEGKYARLDAQLLAQKPADTVATVMGAVAAFAGGLVRPPSSQSLSELVNWAVGAKAGDARTLGRCIFRCDKQAIFVWREARNLPDVELQPGNTVNWDNRYRIFLSAQTEENIRIAAIGADKAAEMLKGHEAKGKNIAISALQSEPAVWCNGHIIATSDRDYGLCDNGLVTFERYCALAENFPHQSDLPLIRVLSLW